MLARPSLASSAVLTVLILAPSAQSSKPEILWQFEAGG